MVADSTHPSIAADKAPDTAPAGDHAATSLSQQATKPGDQGALSSVKDKGTAQGLPEVHIQNDNQSPAAPPAEKPPTLDQKTLENTARELHDALNQSTFLGMGHSPDMEKINHLLAPLGEADRKALEKAYHDIYDKNGPQGTLRHDMKAYMGESDYRRCEATLNTKDGTTNDAGALITALADSKHDSERGSAEVRAVLQNLNSQQLQKLDADFKQQFGKSYLDALKESKDLTKATRDSLPILEKGVDKRSAEDLTNLARIGIANGDRRLFAEAVRGDSREAVAARHNILTDNNLKEKLAQAFPSDAALNQDPFAGSQLSFEQKVDPVALDYLKDGRISLATIASADTGKWLLDNKNNIELASKNATPAERQDFAKGQEIALSGKKPGSAEEQRQLDFYNKIDGAFKNGGNDREVSIWEDQLIHGRETIISQMAKTHSNGYVWGLIGAGHDKNELMSKVEHLSPEDRELLRGPDGDKFKREIAASLDTYAPQDKARIMQMLQDKANAGSDQEAAKIHRGFNETVQDSKSSVFLGMGTTYDGKTLIKNIMDMSPADAANYKNNQQFKQSVDNMVKDNFTPEQQTLARQLLSEIGQTGKPPKITAPETVLNDSIQGASNSQILADAEKALEADPALRQAMSKPDNQLSEIQKQFRNTVQNAVQDAISPPASSTVEGGMPLVSSDQIDKYTKTLFQTGHIPADLKSDLGFNRDQVITSAAAAPQGERDNAMKALSPDEQAVVNGIRQNQDGKPDLADRIRMMAMGAGGCPEDFKTDLSHLSFTDRQKLKDEYTKKYGKDLDQDFLDKVGKGEKSSYENLLRPADTDGRQTYYDNYHKMLRSESGFSPDGSQMTMERANDMYQQGLEEYQKVYKTLPPEKQHALDEYFNKSLEQYKNSKEKMAEILIDATITATALAAAPFTGGASLGAVVAMSAAAGAAFRVGAMKAIEGNDMDCSAQNLCKQLIIGGSSAALNFIGGEVITGAGNLAKGVSEQAIAGLAAGGRDMLGQGGKQILENGLPGLIARGGKDVSEKELAALVSKAAPAASASQREAIARGLKETIASTYDQTQAKITEQIAQRTTRETAAHLGKEAFANSAVAAGGNIASEVLVAPFNEHGIDWDALKNGGLQGAAIGAVLPVALKGLIHAAGACSEMVTNVTRRADGLYLDPHSITEPITMHNTTTGEVRTIEPGKGDALKLSNDWQAESGGRPVKPADKLRDASGKPVENPHAQGDNAGDSGSKPSAEAVAQSNNFAKNHEVQAPLEDGFTYASANRQFDGMGRPKTGNDPSFVVDKKELAPVIADAKQRFMNLPPEERAEALAKYVHEKFNPAGMSQQDVNKWYLDYLQSHQGQKITLGQLLKEGKGVCTQEAVLLKVLGDELGLKPTLIRGNGLDGGTDINHAWTTFDFGNGPRVFDPRQGIHNLPADQVPSHRPGSDIVAGHSGSEAAPRGADQYRYNDSDGWHIDAHNPDGTVEVSRPGVETVKTGDGIKDFHELNSNQLARDGGLKVGQHYKVRRADGSIDESFKLDGVNADGSLRVSSERAEVGHNVNPENLQGGKPEMSGSPEDLKKALADKKTSFDDFFLHATADDANFKNSAIRDLVKTRLEQEVRSPEFLEGKANLTDLAALAKDFGLQSDFRSFMSNRLTGELRNNPDLLSDPAHANSVNDILSELRKAPDANDFRSYTDGVLNQPDALDPSLEKEVLASVNKALSKEGVDGAELATLKEIGAVSGSNKIQNAVRFYEVTGERFKGELSFKFATAQETDRQIQILKSLQDARYTSKPAVHYTKFEKLLKQYGYELSEEGAQHNRDVLDSRTGKTMKNITDRAQKNEVGEPTEKVGVSLTHKKGEPKDLIKPGYQNDVLDNLLALYASGQRQ